MSTTFRTRIAMLAVVLLALPLLAACGGPSAPSDVNVSLKTFTITLSSPTAKAGDVTFHIKNDATDITHEFVILKTDQTPEQLLQEAYDAANKTLDEEKTTPVTEMEDIDPGKGGDLKANLAAGHYVLVCNTPDHYKAGMHAEFTVVP